LRRFFDLLVFDEALLELLAADSLFELLTEVLAAPSAGALAEPSPPDDSAGLTDCFAGVAGGFVEVFGAPPT